MNPNPNESTLPMPPRERVDRAQRDGLANTIRQFLREQSTAFKFDEALDDYRSSTDPTVRFVTNAAWLHYDDCDDHVVTLSKREWDYFQRLLLLLESDGQIVMTSTRRWSWTQLIAGASLLVFVWCIWHFGWGQHLLAFSIPLGVVSIVISCVRGREGSAGPYDHILTPFSSFSDLAVTYRIGHDFTGCDCCVGVEHSAAIAKPPLRDLTYDDLERYSRKAISIWGNTRHFKQFLPRLLELTVEHRDDFLDLAVVFGKLAFARWHSWPQQEQNAVNEFFAAFWQHQLADPIVGARDRYVAISPRHLEELRAYGKAERPSNYLTTGIFRTCRLQPIPRLHVAGGYPPA